MDEILGAHAMEKNTMHLSRSRPHEFSLVQTEYIVFPVDDSQLGRGS